MALISPLEQAYQAIESYLTQEITEEGLLEDVNTFITSESTHDHIDAPIVWFEKETIQTTNTGAFNNETLLDIPFNMVCCAEIVDDYEQAENDSINLANRCITSMFKNVLLPREVAENITVRGFTINTIDPNGTFEIINKTTLLPATRVSLTFHVMIDWMLYIEDDTEVRYDEDEGFYEDIIFDKDLLNNLEE